MAKTKNVAKPKPKKPAYRVNKQGKRVRNLERHKSFVLSKKIIKTPKKLPGFKELIKEPTKLVFSNKKLFFGLVLIYATLNFVFIKGFGSAFNLSQTKSNIEEVFGSELKPLESSYVLFDQLLTSFSGSVQDSLSSYQMISLVFLILAVIWLCRKLFNNEKPKLKQAFYNGMYPIVPFILVSLVIALQLMPLVLGNFLFSTVIQNGIAVAFVEKFLWFIIFALLALLSLYLLTSSLFATIIVTLQDVSPMQALRSARELVLHRRLGVFARLLLAPIVILIVLAIIFMPLVMISPFVAEILFLLIGAFALIFGVVYLYNLYRKLL